MLLDPDTIRKRLDRLRELDSHLSLFGAEEHRYELHPTITDAKVAEYEQQQSISIPHDYRQFLTEIGNGGAGPFYGLLGLPDEFGDRDLSAPFKYTRRTLDVSGALDEIEQLDEDDDNYDEKYEELTLRYWTTTNADGALHVCEYGCCLRFFLALNGEERGSIWFDATPDLKGFSPVRVATPSNRRNNWCMFDEDVDERVTFAQWYDAWLDWALDTVSQPT